MLTLENIRPVGNNGALEYLNILAQRTQANNERIMGVFSTAYTGDITIATTTTIQVKNGLIVGIT